EITGARDQTQLRVVARPVHLAVGEGVLGELGGPVHGEVPDLAVDPGDVDVGTDGQLPQVVEDGRPGRRVAVAGDDGRRAARVTRRRAEGEPAGGLVVGRRPQGPVGVEREVDQSTGDTDGRDAHDRRLDVLAHALSPYRAIACRPGRHGTRRRG